MNPLKSGTKRPRSALSSGSHTPKSSPESDVVVITPHTLRLLKLIEEGSSEHAKMAAVHLKAVTAGSSPLVLWEVLGRLQSFLTSPDWRTRSNASMAMEGVAQHLPQTDQHNFLQAFHQSSNDDLWLTLTNLKKELGVILTKGRHLMSSSETGFDDLEEEELQQLDSHQQGTKDFCELRIQLQRRILASRIGLSGILNQVTGKEVQSAVFNDLIPSTIEGTKKRKVQSKQEGISVRALLIKEIKQQQQEQQQINDSSNLLSHQKAQNLLAAELIYRMFDQSWFVRHGSLMGILALVRAWRVHRSKECFGSWPHDILARCLCVLALDRFGDFSETSNADMSGGTVAPVREMAGQVFSAIFVMAPQSIQRDAFGILEILTVNDEWEVRHGALIAMKYTSVLVGNILISQDAWSNELVKRASQLAIERLEDKSDDVQSVAARFLNTFLANRGDKNEMRSIVESGNIVGPLWTSLEKARLVSSSIKDLVGLFSTLVEQNCSQVLNEISSSNVWNSFQLILERLDVLLTCEYSSVKLSVVQSVGFIIVRLDSFCQTNDIKSDKTNKTLQSAYCQIMKSIHDLYARNSLLDEIETNTKIASLESSYRKLWSTMVRASRNILAENEQNRLDLQSYLLLSYFDLQTRQSSVQDHNATGVARVIAFSGRQLQVQTEIAKAVSSFLVDSLRLTKAQSTTSQHLFELCMIAALESPLASEFQSACLLFDALFGQSKDSWKEISWVQSLKLRFEDTLRKLLQNNEEPLCLKVERSGVVQDNPMQGDILHQIFSHGVKMVQTKGASGGVAASMVIELRKKTILAWPSQQIQSRNMTANTMRVSVSIVGALVAGGYDCFPPKLTPLIRALMTSLQNETDKSCQMVTSKHMAVLLDILSGTKTVERIDGFKKTHGKVVTNLCNLVVSQRSPGCVVASDVIGLLVKKVSIDRLINELGPLWEAIRPLRENFEGKDIEPALCLFQALCGGSSCDDDGITEYLINLYCGPIAVIGCTSRHLETCSKIIKKFYSLNATLTLKRSLPSIVRSMKDRANDFYRIQACEMLQSLLDEKSMAICAFVRSLLPLAMSMMTDPSEECAKAAASIFSCLVQLAPLVQESSSLEMDTSIVNEKADLVIDHLIHGKPLPDCTLHPLVLESLRTSGTILRKYQLEGISWLRFLQTVNLNGALCDSMGLGKTLQALVGVALSHLDNEDTSKTSSSLIVCPSSVVGHWMSEIGRFFPDRKVFKPMSLRGTEAQRTSQWNNDMRDCNIVVISYATLRSDIVRLAKIQWCYCVLDEGHLLKNPKTATARASRRLKSIHRLILTGTPVQNKVFEVWSTFDFLMPNFLGTQASFSKEFARPITKGQSIGASASDVATSMEKLKVLHQQVLPFILRREKEQVLKELPPKTITTILCDMSPLQSQLYSKFCSGKAAQKSLESLEQAIKSMEKQGGGLPSRLGSDVLRSFLYLRLLCTYPALVDSGTERWDVTNNDTIEFSGKLLALSELLRNMGMQSQSDKLTAADNDSSLIYCEDDSDMLEQDELHQVLQPESYDGEVLSIEKMQSNKDSKCLIFAQFTRSLDVVEHLLLRPNMTSDDSYVRLDGKVPLEERARVVDRFNNDDSVKIMLLTTRIGGLGLNLTGADTVIFLEHDWNPHADLQSMDRAHRIGQKRKVHVYRLVTANSIEEKIMKLHEVKLAMSKALVNTENSTMFSMGTDRLLDIFRYRSEVGKDTDSSQNMANTLDSLVERYEDEYQDLSDLDFILGFSSQ